MKTHTFRNGPGRSGLPARQKGEVLLVGLGIFVVLALLGVTYAQSAIMQERLAGNFKDLSVAFQSAEAGTRWPSAWLQSLGGNTLSRPFPCNFAQSGKSNTTNYLLSNEPNALHH